MHAPQIIMICYTTFAITATLAFWISGKNNGPETFFAVLTGLAIQGVLYWGNFYG
jgi:uncharacterized membrane protein YgaE (UPF0421/DUF939 family)